MPRLALAAVACVAAAAVIPAGSAFAQFFFFRNEGPFIRQPHSHRAPAPGRSHYSTAKEKTEKKQKAEEPAPPAGPLFFVISTNKQHVSVYSPNGLYVRSPISTGRPDHPTPHGIFSIIGKERFHESNIYSGAPMPYMQRITWSGVAMHEGVLPGYAASHGCIRMPHEFAKRLFGYTQGNERVVISNQDIVPANISHPRLFTPKLMEAPASLNMASVPSQMLQNAISVAAQAGKVDIAVKPDTAETKPGSQKLLNPYEFAKAMQALAAKQASDASASLGPARKEIEAKAKEVREATITLRKAEIALASAKDKLGAAERLVKGASDGEQSKALAAARDEAQARVPEAEAALESAKRIKAEKDQAAASALRAYNDTDNSRKAAADVIKSWNRRLAPLSIFVSRKTQRLYIRQGFVRVFDVPVTVRDPDKPIGTHLYIAMPEQGAASGAGSLHWLVLTLPDANTATEEEPGRRRRKHYEDDAPRAAQPAPSASEALDRIEVPAEVREKVSEMLLAGSSLIVSDKPMSGETGDHTDFVILTR